MAVAALTLKASAATVSAATGGTYGGGSLLTGDQSFNAAGSYTVNTLTETPTAS